MAGHRRHSNPKWTALAKKRVEIGRPDTLLSRIDFGNGEAGDESVALWINSGPGLRNVMVR